MTTRLFFIRHGESRGNVNRQWQGWLDEPLTERGRGQAERLAERICRWTRERSEPIQAVYTSTLARSWQTAEVLVRRLGVPLVMEQRLRERSVGVLEGLTWPEIEAQHPELARALNERWMALTVPGGESLLNLSDRVWRAVQDIQAPAAGDGAAYNVAIVSHGGALNAYFGRLVGREAQAPFIFRFGNTSLSVVEIHRGRPRILSINDQSHLE